MGMKFPRSVVLDKHMGKKMPRCLDRSEITYVELVKGKLSNGIGNEE